MAKGAAGVSQVRQQLPDNNVAGDAMHEQHVENIVATEFNLQEAKKKLRTLQETKVSQEGDLSTPKVSGCTLGQRACQERANRLECAV